MENDDNTKEQQEGSPPFHIAAGSRFMVSMTRMSSYHHFTLWMFADGSPIPADLARGRGWDDRLQRVGFVRDTNFHGDRTRAKAAALGLLMQKGYKPGMTAAETKALLPQSDL